MITLRLRRRPLCLCTFKKVNSTAKKKSVPCLGLSFVESIEFTLSSFDIGKYFNQEPDEFQFRNDFYWSKIDTRTVCSHFFLFSNVIITFFFELTPPSSTHQILSCYFLVRWKRTKIAFVAQLCGTFFCFL